LSRPWRRPDVQALCREILDEVIAMASAIGERIGIDEAARIMATY
jgi:ketopantoate reductase